MNKAKSRGVAAAFTIDMLCKAKLDIFTSGKFDIG